MTFLRDPIWTFISVVVAVLVGIVAIAVAVLSRNRKALSYAIESDVPIVTVRHGNNNAVTEDIEIRYKDRPVHDVRLVVVRVWNSGNQSVIPADQIEPITITFWGNMLASDVVETSPPSLKRDAVAGGGVGPGYQAIVLRNQLLNRKDSITVQALMTDFTGKVAVDGRIVGVSTIQQATRPWIEQPWALPAASIVFIAVGAVFALAVSNGSIFGAASLFAVAAGATLAGSIADRLWSRLGRH